MSNFQWGSGSGQAADIPDAVLAPLLAKYKAGQLSQEGVRDALFAALRPANFSQLSPQDQASVQRDSPAMSALARAQPDSQGGAFFKAFLDGNLASTGLVVTPPNQNFGGSPASAAPATRAAAPAQGGGTVSSTVGGLAPSPAASPSAPSSYVIKQGDTLSKIAAANGTTVAALAAANGISDPNKIRAGATLSMPGASSNPSRSLGITPPASGLGSTARTNELLGRNAFNPSTGAPMGGAQAQGVTIVPTGDPATDQIAAAVKAAADGLLNNGFTLPDNLKITPTLMQDFLDYAHQQGDPYTKQLISTALPNINASLGNLANKYGNDMGQIIQDFGTSLATEQNTSGANGTAFSGLRNLTERNMAASTNRSLSTLGSQAATDIGNTARAGAAMVGSDNAGGINLPTLSTGAVSFLGGSRGSSNSGSGLDYNYNPSLYNVGKIYSDQNTAINTRAQDFNSIYGSLAGANTGRSMADLFKMATGASQAPSNLQ